MRSAAAADLIKMDVGAPWLPEWWMRSSLRLKHQKAADMFLGPLWGLACESCSGSGGLMCLFEGLGIHRRLYSPSSKLWLGFFGVPDLLLDFRSLHRL